MKKIFYKLTFISLTAFLLFNYGGCSDPASNNEPVLPVEISGYVQKGPFINGTQINLHELNSDLGQTGNSFVTQIANDYGSFEISDLDLSSNYVLLSANGYYFDEVRGEISSSQLSLHALSDIDDRASINVNILTHLERGRIEQLISEGSSFSQAKETAQNELLSVFGIEQSYLNEFETFNISENNEQAAILLAISLIFQGDLSVGDLSELLANFSADFRSDGSISDKDILAQLSTSAFHLDYEAIRANLESRYESLGINADVPNFEKYIDDFVSNFDGNIQCTDLVVTDQNGTVIDIQGNPSDQWKVTSPGSNKSKTKTNSSSEQILQSISQGNIEIPSNYSIDPAFPNPTDGSYVELRFQLPETNHVKIALYQSTFSYEYIVNEKLPAGNHGVSIDLDNKPGGCYKLEFQSGDRSAYGLILHEK